jgi:sortase (surface protein transpeptidase)
VPHRRYQAIADRSGRQTIVSLIVAAAALAGVAAIVAACGSQQSAPKVPASAAGTISFQTPASTTAPGRLSGPSAGSGPSAAPPLSASIPVTIDIPAIDVHSAVIPIGTAPDGTLAVPHPGPDLNKAAWYTNSVTPGQDGPSVIEGHIDSVQGPSVFYELGAVRPGDRVDITRTDGSRTVFTVNAVRSYASHAAFPTDEVYGADLGQPTLRLITCSNFDQSTGHYVGNTVVFAHLTAVHRVSQAR